MPYIKQEDRQALDPHIDALVNQLVVMSAGDGEVNYAITGIIRQLYLPISYHTLNRAIGLLECIKQEFYRRVVAVYEQEKCEEHGEVY